VKKRGSSRIQPPNVKCMKTRAALEGTILRLQQGYNEACLNEKFEHADEISNEIDHLEALRPLRPTKSILNSQIDELQREYDIAMKKRKTDAVKMINVRLKRIKAQLQLEEEAEIGLRKALPSPPLAHAEPLDPPGQHLEDSEVVPSSHNGAEEGEENLVEDGLGDDAPILRDCKQLSRISFSNGSVGDALDSRACLGHGNRGKVGVVQRNQQMNDAGANNHNPDVSLFPGAFSVAGMSTQSASESGDVALTCNPIEATAVTDDLNQLFLNEQEAIEQIVLETLIRNTVEAEQVVIEPSVEELSNKKPCRLRKLSKLWKRK
jgi:hypothetical protein